MKKVLLVLLTALVLALSVVPVTVCAAPSVVVIAFSSEGPDTYPDGNQVRDGECYALVWTPEGETFEGFLSDGSAAGNSKVAVTAPIAKGGRCPLVQFQLNEETASLQYPGGTWGVYLLDTRVDDENGKVASGVKITVRGYVKINDGIDPYVSPAGGVGNGVVQNIPAGIAPPTIKDFQVINGMAYLFLKNATPAIPYNNAAEQSPGSLSPKTQQAPLDGGAEEVIIITPATEAGGFYRGIVQTMYSEGNPWVVLSVAVILAVSVSVLALIKKEKKPAPADSTEG